MRDRWRAGAVLTLILLLGLAWPAFAIVPVGGDDITFAETIHDDLYIAGGTVTVTGNVDGDIVAAGGTVTFAGPVSGAVLAAGGTVDIGASVGRSVRAAGGTIRLDASTGTDAVVIGGTITFVKTSRVGRDVVAAGGAIRLAGTVGRNVFASGGNVLVGGTVQGDVDVQADRVVVLSSARIGGRLRYAAGKSSEIQSGAQVTGGIERVPSGRRGPGVGRFGARLSRFRPVWLVGEWVWLLGPGLVIFALLPRVPEAVVPEIRSRFGVSLLAGFLILVAAPIAVTALLISVVGIPLAGALVLVGLLTLYPGQLFAATWLGERALNAARKEGPPSVYWALVVGVTILVVLYAIPILGWVLRLVAMLVGFGAIWIAVWRTTRGRTMPTGPSTSAVR